MPPQKLYRSFFSKNERGQWQETIMTRNVPANEIPEDIRRKVENNRGPVDITDEVQAELHLEV